MRPRAALVLLPTLTASAAPARPRRGADDDMSGQRELRMAHCPSAVDGAKTEVSDLPNGVVVTVRSPDDPLAAAEIQWMADGARLYVRADDADAIARLQKATRKRAAVTAAAAAMMAHRRRAEAAP